MSASLVGSEMCIRDRPAEPPRRPVSEPAAPSTGKAQLVPARDASKRGDRCLLYTSDAADDM
eukprot:9633191-Alexandrium_andersonii.AAC.1